jgi:hypothetical protein
MTRPLYNEATERMELEARRAIRVLQHRLGHDDPLSTMMWLLYEGKKAEVRSMQGYQKADGWHVLMTIMLRPHKLPDAAILPDGDNPEEATP